MKCHLCEVCGKPIQEDIKGTKLCVPVIIGTAGGSSPHCWCVCDGCQDEFLSRSAKVLQKNEY